MPTTKSELKTMVEKQGFPLASAVKALLAKDGENLTTWSRAKDLNRAMVSTLLNGSATGPHYEVRAALAEHFHVSPSWLEEHLPK